MTNVAKDKQIRAWLLVKAEALELAELAAAIRETVNKEVQDSEKTFIIRADVTGGPFNLIMPVYAETDALMRKVIGSVRAYPGVTQVLEARVSEHVPELPHEALGYVTEAEATPQEGLLEDPAEAKVDTLKGLRGENAWG